MIKIYLYRICEYIKNKYIELFGANYKYKRPQIIYDKALRGYVATDSTSTGAFFDIETLAEELCCDNCIFRYKVDNKLTHEHELRRVIQDAYMYGEQFEIPKEYELDYSEQELRILKKIAIVGQSRINAYKKFLDENNMYDPSLEID